MKKFIPLAIICLLFCSIASLVLQLKLYKKFSKVEQIATSAASSMAPVVVQGTNDHLEMDILNQKLVRFLKVYSAYDHNGNLQLVRHGKPNDGGYVVATKAFESADALLGYGINDDNSFEDNFSEIYAKPSYGFDCGITHINAKSPLFTFVDQCIGSDRTLYNTSQSSGKISTFEQQVGQLKLKGKKLFIKMDIEGAEYEAFEGILPYHSSITGIALEIHFHDIEATKKALKLLSSLDKNFVLLHVHGNNCCVGFSTPNSIGKISRVLELSYIHKSLITNYHVAKDQTHPTAIDMPNNIGTPEAEFEVLLD